MYHDEIMYQFAKGARMGAGRYRMAFRPDLEGLRAVAILAVVAVHAGVPWLRGGYVGVDVFFVLSGFLITGLLVNEVGETGRLRFVEFYVRRLRRLLPALVVLLLVVSAAASLLLSPAEQFQQSSAAAMAALWLGNFHFAFARLGYFSQGQETNLFLHTWSLGVEEQFYLIWPALLVWVMGRDTSSGLRRLKAAMSVVFVASLVGCIVLSYDAPRLAFYMMPLRAWQFAAGALVWIFFNPGAVGATLQLSDRWQSLTRAGGWLGLACIALAAATFGPQMAYPGIYALLPTLGAVAVIAAGSASREAGGVSQVLSLRPLQGIGRVSYSWYLWHWPILLLGRAATGSDDPLWRGVWVALSFLLAVLSYRFIESTTRHRQWWLSQPRASLYASLALMLLVCAVSLDGFGSPLYKKQPAAVALYQMARSDAPVIYGMGCDDWFHSDRIRICAFGPADAPHTAVLIGDSHAGQWFPAVSEVFARPGWRLLVLTKSACPMVDESFFYPRIGREYTECSTWRRHAMERVAELKPDMILMGSADSYGFTQRQWIEGTGKVLKVLAPAAGHVYILRNTPSLPFDGPNCLEQQVGRPTWLGSGGCTVSLDKSSADLELDWLSRAASRYPNVRMLDMNASICPKGICSAELGGQVVFRDAQHLTARFAASLEPALASKLGIDAASSTGAGSASR